MVRNDKRRSLSDIRFDAVANLFADAIHTVMINQTSIMNPRLSAYRAGVMPVMFRNTLMK